MNIPITTSEEIASQLYALREKLALAGPQSVSVIEALERSFNLSFPTDYRFFLIKYGALWSREFSLIGIGDFDKVGLSISDAILMFRLANQDSPKNLIPIEDLGEGCFACIVTEPDDIGRYPVIGYDINNPPLNDELPLLAVCFNNYIYSRLIGLLPSETSIDQEYIEKGWMVFEKHVQTYNDQFQYSHSKGGKLPRNHEWRPYRYCIQDVVFGIVVVKHSKENNRLDVDVFLTADVPEYGPLAGARALASFLLSEAFKCGGTMEIQFTEEVEDGRVPKELQLLADAFGLTFLNASKGNVSPDEAKLLYASLTDFSPAFSMLAQELEEKGRLKRARACYVVNNGVWSKEQVEMIALGSEHPDRLLGGFARPIQRHLYHHDIEHARAAILGDMLDRKFRLRERLSDADTSYDLEDDIRAINIEFDGSFYAKIYQCDEDLYIPWLFPEKEGHYIPAGTKFNILIRARDKIDLKRNLSTDIKQATIIKDQTNMPTFILVPQDFNSLEDEIQKDLIQKALLQNIGLMISPDPAFAYDNDAVKKLNKSRILRQ